MEWWFVVGIFVVILVVVGVWLGERDPHESPARALLRARSQTTKPGRERESAVDPALGRQRQIGTSKSEGEEYEYLGKFVDAAVARVDEQISLPLRRALVETMKSSFLCREQKIRGFQKRIESLQKELCSLRTKCTCLRDKCARWQAIEKRQSRALMRISNLCVLTKEEEHDSVEAHVTAELEAWRKKAQGLSRFLDSVRGERRILLEKNKQLCKEIAERIPRAVVERLNKRIREQGEQIEAQRLRIRYLQIEAQRLRIRYYKYPTDGSPS